MGKRKGKKGRTISVDMSEAGGSFKCRDGIYLATVTKIDQEESVEGNDYLLWYLTTDAGNRVLHNTSLLPQALWNLRETMESCGLEVPESTLDIDLDDLEGSQLGIEIENEVYQGKKRPRVIDTFPADEMDERLNEYGDTPADDADDSTEPDEPDDTNEIDIEVGSLVTCDDGDEGTVTEIDGDTITVDVDGTGYEVALDSLTLRNGADDTAEEIELAEDCTITFEDQGVEYEGKVSKLNKKKCEVDVENEDGDLETWELKPDDDTITVTEAPE